MAGAFPFVAPEGDSLGAPSSIDAEDGAAGESAGAEPLHVRDPDVVRALSDAVAILGPDLRPRMMLGRLGGYVGLSRLENLDLRLAQWVHHDDLPVVLDALARSRRAPAVDVEAQVRVHNEHDGWHDMTLVFCNFLDHPDVQGTIVRAVDQTLFDREVRWRTLVAESPIGIFEVDLDDRCTFVNPAFARLTGLSTARPSAGVGRR